jgi:hypothetical protein
MGGCLPLGRNGCVGCVGCAIPLLLLALGLLAPLKSLWPHSHYMGANARQQDHAQRQAVARR